MEKEFHLGKGFTGHFPPCRPASAVPRPIFTREPSLPPITTLPSLIDGARLSGPFSPNWCRLADHTSPPLHYSATTCAPAPWSHRISSSCHVASCQHCPLLCCHTSLRQPRCHARSSTTKPRAACPAGRANTAENVPSRPRVALPTCACIAGYAWCAGAPHCATWTPGCPPLCSSPPRRRRTDSTHPVCPSRGYHCRCASVPRERTLALPPR
jgi:hypothetical protein